MDDEFLKQIKEKIENVHDKNELDAYKQKIIDNIEKLSKNQIFFDFPLNFLFSIFSEIDFSLHSENQVHLIDTIIKNTIKSHENEDKTLLLLKYLKIQNCSFSFEEILNFLKNFTNSDILIRLNQLYEENNHDVEFDYEYELQQKDKEIKRLQVYEIPDNHEPEIFKACLTGNLPSVKHLIEKEGIYANSENWTGDPLIIIAAENGHLDIVKYLIEEQKISPDTRGRGGISPLQIACQRGHNNIVSYLIEQNRADIESTNQSGMTPLHFACESGHLNVIRNLIFKGANKEAKDNKGRTPLYIACENGYINIVKTLVSIFHVNVNAQENDLWTPLHIAANRNKTQIVEFLVSNGADKTIKNNYGLTPFEMTQNEEIKRLLAH